MYGYGDFSPIFTLEASDYPGKPPIASVGLESTNVVITWQAPSSHFAVIDNYQVLIKKADG